MFTKEQLLEKVKNNKLANIDKVSAFLKVWRIDPIYEDDHKVEYYDELAVYKLNHGIKLKEMGRNNDEISSIINNGITSPINAPALKKAQINTIPNHPSAPIDLNKVTLDVTAQTLSLLAESIASKISCEINDKIRESNVFEPIMDSAKIRRDNEILSSQVGRLLEENKKLIARNILLQNENAKFKHLFGNWYLKEQ